MVLSLGMGKLDNQMRKKQSTWDRRKVDPYLFLDFEWPNLQPEGKTRPLMSEQELKEFLERRKRYADLSR